MIKPKFLRFLFVGAMNTAFGYGLFALLTWLGLSYPLAIGLATICGVAFNFLSTGKLVFAGAPWHRIGRFISVYGLLYCLNVVSLSWLLAQGLNIYLANALLVIPLAVLSYFLQQKFVFNSI